MSWLVLLRYVHVLAAAAWLGEVVVINFVLLPALDRGQPGFRASMATKVMPRFFRLASILSVTTVLTGAGLAWQMSGGSLTPFLTTTWGRAIAVGGTLGALVTLFHLVVERRIGRKTNPDAGDRAASTEERGPHRIVPRIGLVVVSLSFLLMMYAVRSP